MTTQHGMPDTAGLRLHPFPGLRYDAAVVGDVGEVTSPPYDVMDRPMIESLLQQHSRNVVRLILPRMVAEPMAAQSPYVRAAQLLTRWRDQRVLTTDPLPALYVYEYGDADYTVCGLLGAVELAERDEHVILPHEDVIDAVVADRLALMSATQANLEPILLVYDGAGSADDVIARARARPPLVDVRAADGTLHRLWQISDRGDLLALDTALAPHQALIADGHHRYATYLQLRARHREAGDGAGPWDRGLALLVDQSQCPLRLGAIHRSIGELSLADLRVPAGFTLSDVTALDDAPAPSAVPGTFVLTDGVDQRLVVWTPAPGDDIVSDAQLLHELLLPAWGVTDDQTGYHHSVDQAVRTATQDDGVAVLLVPTTVSQVMQLARAGTVMPRKSTSFGPKPRMGLVMRTFDSEG